MSLFQTMWASLTRVIDTVRPVDFIDIAVVAFIVYKGIKLVRDTRAGQLVKGILILAISYLVALQIGMKTVSFILYNVMQVGLIAIVVVFQPELRRALEHVGRTKVAKTFNLFADSESAEVKEAKTISMIEALCDAASYLSRQKIGALVVIERETKLAEIISTGTVINADATEELIGNIFFPNSPLHDGALIIKDARLYAAGCFLPLSENHKISKELGTRHRAALGMSENSDALVIIVSEETGIISIAEDGKLSRGYTEQTLKAKIIKELLPDRTSDVNDKKSGFWRVKFK